MKIKIYSILILLCVLLVLSIYSTISMSYKKRKQLERYTLIKQGMTERQMLDIMGGNYNVSTLKNNRKKYEWRINSTSQSIKGTGMRMYSGVKKLDIYTKNGFVEEIRPYNI